MGYPKFNENLKISIKRYSMHIVVERSISPTILVSLICFTPFHPMVFEISFPVSVVTVYLPHFQTPLEIILLMIYPSNPYPYELFHYIPVIFPYLLVKSLHGNSAKSKAVLVCHKPTKLASSIISNRRKNPKGRKIRS